MRLEHVHGDDLDAQTVNPLNDASNGTDAPATGDASIDANDGGPPIPTWCQTNQPHAFFCADFDEGDVTKAYVNGTLQKTFTVTTDGGIPGEIAEIDGGGESAPGDLSTALPVYPDNGASTPQATVDGTLPDAPGTTAFQLDFDLRLAAEGDLNFGVVYQLKLVLNDATYPRTNYFEIAVSGGSNVFIGPKPGFIDGSPFGLGPLPTVGVWTHYQMTVYPGGNCTARLGSGDVIDGGPAYVNPTTTQATLSIGQLITTIPAPSGGSTFDFDNVVLNAFGPDGGTGG